MTPSTWAGATSSEGNCSSAELVVQGRNIQRIYTALSVWCADSLQARAVQWSHEEDWQRRKTPEELGIIAEKQGGSHLLRLDLRLPRTPRGSKVARQQSQRPRALDVNESPLDRVRGRSPRQGPRALVCLAARARERLRASPNSVRSVRANRALRQGALPDPLRGPASELLWGSDSRGSSESRGLWTRAGEGSRWRAQHAPDCARAVPCPAGVEPPRCWGGTPVALPERKQAREISGSPP